MKMPFWHPNSAKTVFIRVARQFEYELIFVLLDFVSPVRKKDETEIQPAYC
jgi:hypothetical protein